jgi:hypothetical protein
LPPQLLPQNMDWVYIDKIDKNLRFTFEKYQAPEIPTKN